MPNELKSLEDLKDAPYNPRLMSNDSAAGLAVSLEEFGDISGIVWNKRTGNLVCGHQRRKALKEKYGDKLHLDTGSPDDGIPPELFVCDGDPMFDEVRDHPDTLRFPIRIVDWDEDKEQAANVAANSELISGEWGSGLGKILSQIQKDLPGLYKGLRFPELRMAAARPTSKEKTDPDDVPEKAPDPVVKSGDLWICGKLGHRILAGDATDPDAYDRLIQGDNVDLCLTDPPYGVGLEYHGYEDTQENLAPLVEKFLPLVIERSRVVLLTPGNCNVHLYMAVKVPKWILGWFVAAGSGSTVWGWNFWQPILAYGPDPYLAAGKGRRPDAYTKMEGLAAQERKPHPCAKPIEVWAWFLDRGSVEKGEVVLDPFLGSGTTLIAAEKLHRKCLAMEIDPTYVQVALERWAAFTGEDPVREDGVKFSELMEGAPADAE